jgi:hypothetical protein
VLQREKLELLLQKVIEFIKNVISTCSREIDQASDVYSFVQNKSG